MVAQHYRWDFIGLSTDTKPTPATSEKVTDGSTYYTSDDSKLYVWYKDQWYEKEVEGGGGTTYTAGEGINITNSTISVDTDTIQPKLTAGENITISDNVISASGGGGGGVKRLTTNDYNFPASDPSIIAGWLLPVGQYIIEPYTDFLPNGNASTKNQSTEMGVLVLTEATGNTYSSFIFSHNFGCEINRVQSNGTNVGDYPHNL